MEQRPSLSYAFNTVTSTFSTSYGGSSICGSSSNRVGRLKTSQAQHLSLSEYCSPIPLILQTNPAFPIRHQRTSITSAVLKQQKCFQFTKSTAGESPKHHLQPRPNLHLESSNTTSLANSPVPSATPPSRHSCSKPPDNEPHRRTESSCPISPAVGLGTCGTKHLTTFHTACLTLQIRLHAQTTAHCISSLPTTSSTPRSQPSIFPDRLQQ